MVFQTFGQTWINTFDYRSNPDLGSAGDATAFAQTIYNALSPLYQAILTTQTQIVRCEVETNYPGGNNFFGAYSPSTSIFGTTIEDSEPLNVAVCVTEFGGFRGRQNRGRCFHSGVGQSGVVGGLVVSAILTALTALHTRDLVGYSAVGKALTPVIASVTSLTLRTMVGFTIDNLVDSMRRRLIGRGS